MDRVAASQRSRNMARIRGRNTKPEIRLRSARHRAGFRFRVCRNDLPGRPDVVFAGPRVAVQVRGCFWHQHKGCRTARVPSSNMDYWGPKLRRTVERDAEKDGALRALGWRVLVVRECEIKSEKGLAAARRLITEAVIPHSKGQHSMTTRIHRHPPRKTVHADSCLCLETHAVCATRMRLEEPKRCLSG